MTIQLKADDVYGPDGDGVHIGTAFIVADIEDGVLTLEPSRVERVTDKAGVAVLQDYSGPLDEVVAFGATVHLEAMSRQDVCLIIEAGGNRLNINIGAKMAHVESTLIEWTHDDG